MCNYGDLFTPMLAERGSSMLAKDAELAYFTWKRYCVSGYVQLLAIGVLIVKIPKPLHTRVQTGMTPAPPPSTLQLPLP